MQGGRLDGVRIDVAGETVEVTRHECDVLLKELAFASGTKGIRAKFEAVGASRLVELDREERAGLRRALDDWPSDRLQLEGIARLYRALSRADQED
jgi:hypothetical protein